MANVPTPEFQKFWSNQIESLRLECGDILQQHSDAEAVIESVRGILISIARLAGCTPCVSRRKPEMDSNRPKHGGDQEESPPVPEGKAAV
jgi:hypothetical protein